MATASLSVEANTGEGTREYVAAALEILDELGIRYEFTPMTTNLEGDVETLCNAVSVIHARCHQMGAPRVGSLLRIDDRTDVPQTLESKIAHVKDFCAKHRAGHTPRPKQGQRTSTFIRNGRAQSVTLAGNDGNDGPAVWRRCPYCGTSGIRINPDLIDEEGQRKDPPVRVVCHGCGRSLDDIAIEATVPRYDGRPLSTTPL